MSILISVSILTLILMKGNSNTNDNGEKGVGLTNRRDTRAIAEMSSQIPSGKANS